MVKTCSLKGQEFVLKYLFPDTNSKQYKEFDKALEYGGVFKPKEDFNNLHAQFVKDVVDSVSKSKNDGHRYSVDMSADSKYAMLIKLWFEILKRKGPGHVFSVDDLSDNKARDDFEYGGNKIAPDDNKPTQVPSDYYNPAAIRELREICQIGVEKKCQVVHEMVQGSHICKLIESNDQMDSAYKEKGEEDYRFKKKDRQDALTPLHQ